MVFIGPNNTGKSNIFDCFKFLSEVVKTRNLQVSVIQRGGFNNIVFDGDVSNTISIELHGSLQIKGEEKKYKYAVELGGNQFGNCYNSRETFVLKGQSPLYPTPLSKKVITEMLEENTTSRVIPEELKLLEFPVDNGIVSLLFIHPHECHL